MASWREDYDWREALGYAGLPGQNGFAQPMRVSGGPANVWSDPSEPSLKEALSVIRVVGEADETDWVGVFWGLHHIGHSKWRRPVFTVVAAGCDYTGWDCVADGCSYIADTVDDLLRWGMSNAWIERLGGEAAIRAAAAEVVS